MAVQIDQTVVPDGLDRAILRSLELAPRAPFSLIATAVGTSEATVARRWRRLERTGVARVTGVLDTATLARSQWMVRLTCRPNAVQPIAVALCGRDDVPWVVVTGTEEVICLITARSHDQRVDLLAVRLPRTRAVLEQESSMLLHRFDRPAVDRPSPLAEALTAEQEAVLPAGPSATDTTHGPARLEELEELDKRIIEQLSRDGRASLSALAGCSGASPSRVARRLDVLRDHGSLEIRCEVAHAALGLGTPAVLRLRVRPGALRSVGQLLTESPETASVAATTGAAQLQAIVTCRDPQHLFAFVADQVGSIPDVEEVTISPVLQQMKQQGIRLSDGLFVTAAPDGTRRPHGPNASRSR